MLTTKQKKDPQAAFRDAIKAFKKKYNGMIDALEKAESAYEALDGENATIDTKAHAGGWTAFLEVVNIPIRWNDYKNLRRRFG